MDRRLRLQKLKFLVEELSDRDQRLKQDSELFEDFFANFPIPVTMWSLDQSGNLISKRGNAVVNDNGTKINDLFLEECADDFKKAHEKAYAGKKISFFSTVTESTYYTRLVPRYTDSGSIIGITGIAWDITSNHVMLEAIGKINNLSKGKKGIYREIFDLSSKAIDASRIKNLELAEGENE